MKILLTIKGEEKEGGEEEVGEGEGSEGVESGRERMIEVNEERNEDDNGDKHDHDDGNNDDEEVEEVDVDESEIDDVAERGLHPLYTDSKTRNENKNNETPPDILLQPIGIGIGELTHHNLTNVPIPMHVRACRKIEGADGFELILESTQTKDKHKNEVANKNRNEDENEGGNGNKNGVQCAYRRADHIAVLVTTRNKVKLNTTNNVIKNHFNQTIINNKSLISLNNNLKFTECSSHLKICSESMIKLKALIEIDVLNLSLVVHEPEIWRR